MDFWCISHHVTSRHVIQMEMIHQIDMGASLKYGYQIPDISRSSIGSSFTIFTGPSIGVAHYGSRPCFAFSRQCDCPMLRSLFQYVTRTADPHPFAVFNSFQSPILVIFMKAFLLCFRFSPSIELVHHTTIWVSVSDGFMIQSSGKTPSRWDFLAPKGPRAQRPPRPAPWFL